MLKEKRIEEERRRIEKREEEKNRQEQKHRRSSKLEANHKAGGTRRSKKRSGSPGNPPLFTMTELNEAVGRLKTGKAPGSDKIIPVALEEAVNTIPAFTLETYDKQLQMKFPKIWKTGFNSKGKLRTRRGRYTPTQTNSPSRFAR
ncbi:hypothetical protein JTB14_033190 [Gonioctena quinquepunctata]|nr:hypothetical protein JTB14_033190 [Gonioctena quinquepunctata]